MNKNAETRALTTHFLRSLLTIDSGYCRVINTSCRLNKLSILPLKETIIELSLLRFQHGNRHHIHNLPDGAPHL